MHFSGDRSRGMDGISHVEEHEHSTTGPQKLVQYTRPSKRESTSFQLGPREGGGECWMFRYLVRRQ